MHCLLDILPLWLDKWRMTVNIGKAAVLYVSRHRTTLPPLQLRGRDIAWKLHIRYLGVEVDS